jgi:molybdenum cofactor guanylyltransferase
VTPELAARLVRAVDGYAAAVPRVEGRPEPACAAYTKAAAAAIATALDSGRPRAAGALEQLRVNWLDGEDPALFTNLNTPAEYEAFLDTARKTG